MCLYFTVRWLCVGSIHESDPARLLRRPHINAALCVLPRISAVGSAKPCTNSGPPTLSCNAAAVEAAEVDACSQWQRLRRRYLLCRSV